MVSLVISKTDFRGLYDCIEVFPSGHPVFLFAVMNQPGVQGSRPFHSLTDFKFDMIPFMDPDSILKAGSADRKVFTIPSCSIRPRPSSESNHLTMPVVTMTSLLKRMFAIPFQHRAK